MQKPGCIFCKIASGELPSQKVFENEELIVILDIAPLNKGHVLVIPKKHIKWVHELNTDTSAWEIAHRISKAIVKSLDFDHVNFITLGYEVSHAHIHVIPRKLDDDLGLHIDWSKRKSFSNDIMTKVAGILSENL